MTDQRHRDNENHLTQALWILGGHFSEMGGANRPYNMSEYEIPLYIAIKVLEQHDPQFPSDEYLNERIVEAAKPVESKIDEHLMQLLLSPGEAPDLVNRFYEQMNKKMRNKALPISCWESLGNYLEQ